MLSNFPTAVMVSGGYSLMLQTALHIGSSCTIPLDLELPGPYFFYARLVVASNLFS